MFDVQTRVFTHRPPLWFPSSGHGTGVSRKKSSISLIGARSVSVFLAYISIIASSNPARDACGLFVHGLDPQRVPEVSILRFLTGLCGYR